MKDRIIELCNEVISLKGNIKRIDCDSVSCNDCPFDVEIPFSTCEDMSNVINFRKAKEYLNKHNQSTDQVNSPTHYNVGKIEVIEAIEDWQLNFNLGNAIKYIARCEHKENKKQDLEKAKWYIERELNK